jgi:short-subunit dehydrogenase
VHIDPDRLEACLDVLAEVEKLPHDHPDHVRVRRATAAIFKSVKQQRRREAREAVLANDNAVTAATATGAEGRVDDETAGIALVSSTVGAVAGELKRARACYICKKRYTVVDAFYHQLCPACALENRERRDIRVDLSGRRALLTGGRAKIGMYIALRLLRDGAHTTITTRFPHDAVRRFQAMPDSADWLHRLRVVGIDLRDPAQVVALADSVLDQGALDILINNAAQTVRRSPSAYAPLIAAEVEMPSLQGIELVAFGRYTGDSPAAAAVQSMPHQMLSADQVTALALRSRETAIDAGGLVPDVAHSNSWVQVVDEVDPIELLEVQLCNSVAPLHPHQPAAPRPGEVRSAPQIRRERLSDGRTVRPRLQGPGPPAHQHGQGRAQHADAHERAGDVRDRPDPDDRRRHRLDHRRTPSLHEDAAREEGFHAPLDLVDGAARVYDPIVRGEQGEDLFGCFLKDYKKSAW